LLFWPDRLGGKCAVEAAKESVELFAALAEYRRAFPAVVFDQID
jgi:hypothetical protein